MTHSVEEFYRKVEALHNKALELHRERYKVQGTYNSVECKRLLDDIRALALDVIHGPVDFDRDFGK